LTFFGGNKIEIANNYFLSKDAQNFDGLKKFWLNFKYNIVSLDHNLIFFENIFDPLQNHGFALANVENVKRFNIAELEYSLDLLIEDLFKKKKSTSLI